MTTREEDVEREDMSIGGITWHSSDADSGPDVGISVMVGENDRLWCGEISRQLFEGCDGPEHFPSDGGWFIVRYGPKNDTKLLAQCADRHEAQEFIEEIASWLRASLPPDDGLERIRLALINAGCTSGDGTYVHCSMEDVLKALRSQPPQARCHEYGPQGVDAVCANCGAGRLEHQARAAMPREGKLREAASAFVAKVEALAQPINGMFQIAAIHGAVWPAGDDHHWCKELAALKEALAERMKP